MTKLKNSFLSQWHIVVQFDSAIPNPLAACRYLLWGSRYTPLKIRNLSNFSIFDTFDLFYHSWLISNRKIMQTWTTTNWCMLVHVVLMKMFYIFFWFWIMQIICNFQISTPAFREMVTRKLLLISFGRVDFYMLKSTGTVRILHGVAA